MPMEAAGNAAVDLLLALGAPSPSSAEAAHRVELGTRLILRGTTGASPSAPRSARRARRSRTT
jgi:DNA-binding LacI/PurR family transcriptional regulator